MRSRRAIPDNRITLAQARTQFALWRAQATDAAVLTMTLDRLGSIYRLPERELEAGLLAEQDKRRRRAAGD
jgi:hypothetical protein